MNAIRSHLKLRNLQIGEMGEMSYLSHKEKYEEAIRRSIIVLKKVKMLQSEGWKASDLNR